MIKAVAFDMDGVLVDTERLAVECWVEAAKNLGIDKVDRELALNVVGFSRADADAFFVKALGDEAKALKLSEERVRLYREKVAAEGVPVKPMAERVLQQLKEADIPAVLVTSTFEEFARERVESTGLLPYFQHTIYGDMVTRRKPDPMIYEMALEKLPYDKSEVAAIEDSLVGIQAARAAGVVPFLVGDLQSPNGEIAEKAAYVFGTVGQAVDFIVGQQGKG